MTDATILLVEDEEHIASLVELYLKNDGYTVELVADGVSALAAAERLQPSLVILDIMLPGMDGLEVCKRLRAHSRVPIIMLTARDGEVDRVLGLELGADDYVTKPFSPRELVARVRAVLRRSERAVEPREHLEVGELVLDVPRLRTTVAGRPVDLTATEFQILATMAREPGRVFTRSQLLDAVHGVAFESYERAIDAHIKNIRRKLEADPARPHFIQTVYGVGYRVAEPEA
jgi:two-component system, OmpR family, alkaline phosphatase synthesis response regulator PhoP